MLKKLHKHYHKGELALRDYLSAHRTILANERTGLSYFRTSLTLFIAGVTFIKFFDSEILFIIGLAFVPIGVFCLIIGFDKYHKRKHMIQSVPRDNEVEQYFDE